MKMMLFIQNSKHRIVLLVAFVAVLIVGVGIYMITIKAPADQTPDTQVQLSSLRSFVDTANKVSGIESGATFNYAFISYGNAANFGILSCSNEVRCDNLVEKPVAKFQQSNQPSSDIAEVNAKTNQVISLHRAAPSFLGEEYPEKVIESRVRDFLHQVYPNFETIEPTLTFNPGMKGVRLNNGNYFYRWDDQRYALPDGLSSEVSPFIQVGITSSGFIFSYDNTIDMYRDALTEL